MKKLFIMGLVVWAGGGLVWYLNRPPNEGTSYRTVRAARGDLLATINATGTIEPEEVVDVGVQIAGEIQSFGADPRDPKKPISYGTPVDQGTVLARLDDSLFRARVDQAEAGVAKAEADVETALAKLKRAENELERTRKLSGRGPGMVAAQEVDLAGTNFDEARAGVAVARSTVAVAVANREEAEVNLKHTTITSPVKGVILDRRVNIGQTVVASLNAPSIFLIAKDLRRMEIWASVNETDVGSIHVGQRVRFTVGAFPKDSFAGKVAQVRLNASMVQNVVTYTVVVEVDNASGKLLPYLTARLQFELDERKGVLTVPNAALRWQPRLPLVDPAFRAEYADARRKSPGQSDPARDAPGSSGAGTLWVRRGDFVRPLPVKVGLTDGAASEISGEGAEEGTEVVVGVHRESDDDAGGASDASSILPHTRTNKKK